MLFNSIPFLFFFPLFLVGYAVCRGRLRLLWCLIASYVFYGWWDVRFLVLIGLSTLADFFLALLVAKTTEQSRRRQLLIASLVFNLGLLGFFKYFNFFADTFRAAAGTFGVELTETTINIILPVGISFYTFQSLSYTVDVYRKTIEPERDLLKYATFVAFFPQLVAGPIVRAAHFLPQLQTDRQLNANAAASGLTLVLFGFFKKLVVADSLAPIVEHGFSKPDLHTSLSLVIVVVFYAFQIYCDFSGYSDIAIGLARIIGFDLGVNFDRPYFSRSFSEFWHRWHISLSTWLRDYLYIPLGGNRGGPLLTYRNLMLTMILGGLWHGASWTFVAWGTLHGLYLCTERALSSHLHAAMDALHMPRSVRSIVQMAAVFTLVCFAWIFFRSPDWEIAFTIVSRIAALDDLRFASVQAKFIVIKGLLVIAILSLLDFAYFRSETAQRAVHLPAFRLAACALCLWTIAFIGSFRGAQFIYFQF
jgi:alginate O-acetyltransferase complex protein AlgI